MTHADTTEDIRLVVLDMAGTTVADGGLVERAFIAAARELGVGPGTDDHADKLAHVRATMGESKISVFRHLFGSPPTSTPGRRPPGAEPGSGREPGPGSAR
ncbi:hypothetical protein NGM36_08115 [Streptomyces mutabilis]|uniref:hypothetical protein n=1 Tax=Streptomyces mutabilis TaxID=67332 RepID=UPI0022BA6852|nr:hypothetical protein [Streptomyces mutabilis]MCZ9349760.1 hypothetical protein [Streptomyces mutabilis]